LVSSSGYAATLERQETCVSITLSGIFSWIQGGILTQDWNLHNHFCEKLKACIHRQLFRNTCGKSGSTEAQNVWLQTTESIFRKWEMLVKYRLRNIWIETVQEISSCVPDWCQRDIYDLLGCNNIWSGWAS
jgi:hypothetical protein